MLNPVYHLMSSVLHSLTSGKTVRRSFVAVALAALSLMLARPICDAYEQPSAAPRSMALAAVEHAAGESVPHSNESGPCCTSVDEATLTASKIPVPAAAKAILSIPTGPSARWPSVVSHRAAVDPPGPTPRSLPYHARSARILV
jgi:hypothetical protein